MRHSDKVQIRLQMTSDQIDERNKQIRANAPREFHKCRRIYNEQNRKVWDGVSKDNPPHSPRTQAHYAYYADQARGIAARKVERKHRKYWNKVARRYDERAEDPLARLR